MKYFAILSILLFSALNVHAQIDSNLLKAIKNNDLVQVEHLIKSGVNIHAVDENGANALMWAVHDAELPLIKLLVFHGARPPEKGVVYLEDNTYYGNIQGIAADRSKLDILAYLADSLQLPLDENGYNRELNTKIEFTPFHYALATQRPDIMKLVLEKTRSRLGNKADHYLSKFNNWINNKVEFKTAKQKQELEEVIVELGRDYFNDKTLNYAYTLLILGNLYYPVGQYQKIIGLYEKGLAIYRNTRGKENYEYAVYAQNLGTLYKEVGKPGEAIKILEEAAGIYLKTKEEDSQYALIITNIAILYKNRNDYENAMPLYYKALDIRKKILGEKHPEYAVSLYNVGQAYSGLGMFDKSISFIEKALSILEEIGGQENANYATMLRNYAGIFRRLEQYDRALPLFEKAAELYKKVSGADHPNYSYCINDLALVYMEKKMYDKALELYNKSLEISIKVLGENHVSSPTIYNNIASVYARKGELDKAIELSRKALDKRNKIMGEDHYNSIGELMDLSLYSLAKKKYDTAILFATKVSNLQSKQINKMYNTLSEFEKINLLNASLQSFYYLPTIALHINQQDSITNTQLYENELKLKGIALLGQQAVMKQVNSKGDQEAVSIYEDWKLNKEFIARQYSLAESKRSPSLDSIELVTNRQEQILSKQSSSLYNQFKKVSLTDVIQQLKEGEAVIEFINFRIMRIHKTDSVMYAALVMKKGEKYPAFVPLFEQNELKNLMDQSNAIGSISKSISFLYGNTQKSNALYNLIWKPLEVHLSGAKKVYFAPSGLLHRISFGAIPVDGFSLMEKYQLNQLLSSRSLVSEQQEGEPRIAALWGDILYEQKEDNIIQTRGSKDADTYNYILDMVKEETTRGEGWKPLPGTKKEIEELAALLQAKNITVRSTSGDKATEKMFKDLSGNSPDVLHLATHGFSLPKRKSGFKTENENVFSVQSNPMFRSGLILAGGNAAWRGQNNPDQEEDGILTAFELAQVDLSNTNLVVLSACETALGDVQGYEGVIGLQRALKMAGVKQMLLTLWQIPDKPTMELMTSFYRNWLSGQTTSKALSDAQLELKKKYPSPYYWGGFVLVE